AHATAMADLDVPGAANRRESDAARGAIVRSPLTGKVLVVLIAEGDQVEKGQEIATVEAMKMENKIFAPAAGRAKGVKATPGANVNAGDVLVEIAPPVVQ